MIHVFFVPGMFGSTIEYVLCNYTTELTPVDGSIQHDGSMHSFNKQNHILNSTDINKITDQQVHTPIYPFNNLHFNDILKIYPISNPQDKYILMYAHDFESAELNILFQYHKISVGLSRGWKIFTNGHDSMTQNVQRWNTEYQSYDDMQPWELREWFSLFYPTWIQEWQQSYYDAPIDWLTVPANDMLTDTSCTLKKIISHCGLSINPGIDEFSTTWQLAQQYIIDEYHLIDNIVKHTLAQKQFDWRPLNPVAEAMIQKKLRDNGVEIQCDGLNRFPINSLELYKLLESNIQLHIQGNI